MWSAALQRLRSPVSWRRLQRQKSTDMCTTKNAKQPVECRCRTNCFALRQILANQLANVQNHLQLSYGLAGYYAATAGEFGAGTRASTVLNLLDAFTARLDRIRRYLKSRKGLTHHRRRKAIRLRLATELSMVLMEDLRRFAGQIMVLPISLEVFNGQKAKDCRVLLDYGTKATTIQGAQFDGKCSRILLDVHPDRVPKLRLIHRKKTMGLFVKEEHAGDVQWSMTRTHLGDCGCVMLELSFTRPDYCKGECPTARAVVQLEWFPKVVEEVSHF